MPKASVPGSEAYENENVNFCNALILKNGTQEAFEAYMKEQGADGYFTYCDQGYTQMHAAYQAQAQGARRLLLLGAAVLCLTAAVCWQIQAHRSAAAIHTMRLLGVSAGVVVGEQLRATLPVIALSSLFGGAAACLAYRNVLTEALTEAVVSFSVGPMLCFAGAAALLEAAAAVLCARWAARRPLMSRPCRGKKHEKRQSSAFSAISGAALSAVAAAPATVKSGAFPAVRMGGRARLLPSALRRAAILAALRRRGSFVLLSVLAFLGCGGILALHGQLAAQQAAWQKSLQETEIRCIVTASDGGSQQLQLSQAVLQWLTDGELEPWVRNVQAMADEPLLEPENAVLRHILGLGSDPLLSSAEGAHVTFADGWDESAFTTAQRVCLVPESAHVALDENGTPYVSVCDSTATPGRLQVIGIVTGGPSQVYYVPMNMPNTKGYCLTDRIAYCAFSIGDNARLQETRDVLYQYFAQPSTAATKSSLAGLDGLLILDEAFLAAKAEAQSSLRLLRLLQPLLFLGMGGVSFLATALCTRRRRRELAIMRCMGISRRAMALLTLQQQMLCAAVGAALALLATCAVPWPLEGRAFAQAGAMLVVFLAGGCAAAVWVGGADEIRLMKAEE